MPTHAIRSYKNSDNSFVLETIIPDDRMSEARRVLPENPDLSLKHLISNYLGVSTFIEPI